MFKSKLLIPVALTLLAYGVIALVAMYLLPEPVSVKVHFSATWVWAGISLAQLHKVFPKTFWQVAIPGSLLTGFCGLLYYNAELFGIVGTPLVALTAVIIVCYWRWPSIKAGLQKDYPETFGVKNRQTYVRTY